MKQARCPRTREVKNGGIVGCHKKQCKLHRRNTEETQFGQPSTKSDGGNGYQRNAYPISLLSKIAETGWQPT